MKSMELTFTGSFTQQEPIPSEAIARATEVLQGGRLHRYNTVEGETAEAALLESEFRDYMGSRYCLAVASGGYALTTALRASGLQQGTAVLTNAFTLSPVPGAIVAAGGKPVLVDVTEDLVIDLNHLSIQIATSGARLLLLSHMRGHIVDMEALMVLCNRESVTVIEDCAHTMGAAWNGVKSGRFGLAGCYSTQTYKHLNSGEGGLIVSDDPKFMARATILSGSYMLYDHHPAGPPAEIFTDIRLSTPNCSGRMDNLRASILRPQLARLEANCARWNARYCAVAAELNNVPGIRLPQRPEKEQFVASSIQFLVSELDPATITDFLSHCGKRGVELKWFGASEPIAFTSRYQSWGYIDPPSLPTTDAVLDKLCDMRLPLTFSLDDCSLIGAIIRDCVLATRESIVDGAIHVDKSSGDP